MRWINASGHEVKPSDWLVGGCWRIRDPEEQNLNVCMQENIEINQLTCNDCCSDGHCGELAFEV